MNLSSIGSESGLEDGSDDDDDDDGHIQIDTTPEPELNRSKQTFSPVTGQNKHFPPVMVILHRVIHTRIRLEDGDSMATRIEECIS